MTPAQQLWTVANNKTHKLVQVGGVGFRCLACKAEIRDEDMDRGPVILGECKGKKR